MIMIMKRVITWIASARAKVLRAVARWVMSEGLLLQYSLAKEQTDRVEGRGNNDAGGDD